MSFQSLETTKKELKYLRKISQETKNRIKKLENDSKKDISNAIINSDALKLSYKVLGWRQNHIKTLENRVTKLIN